MTEDTAAFTATIKAGSGYDAPWIVIRANTADELKNLLRQAHDGLSVPLTLTAQVFQADWSGATPPQGQAHNHGFGTGSQSNGDEHPTGQGGGGNQGGGSGGNIETNKWGGTFEWNHPQAPDTRYGKKVLKRWRAQSGKDSVAWIDPRDPSIPSVYQKNGKDRPSDLLDLEWAKGV